MRNTFIAFTRHVMTTKSHMTWCGMEELAETKIFFFFSKNHHNVRLETAETRCRPKCVLVSRFLLLLLAKTENIHHFSSGDDLNREEDTRFPLHHDTTVFYCENPAQF